MFLTLHMTINTDILHFFVSYRTEVQMTELYFDKLTLYFTLADFYFVACLLVQGGAGCDVGSTVYTS